MTSGKKVPVSDPREPAHWPKTAGGPNRGSYVETRAGEDDQFDARHYRPLHVVVQLEVCDAQAHLVRVTC